MARILISGGSGFIGKNFIELCKQYDEFEIIAYINSDDINGIKLLNNYGIVVLTEQNIETYAEDIDYTLHLASYGVAYGARDVNKMIDVNIKLTAYLLNFSRKHNCKLFINTGSCFEYGTQDEKKPLIEETKLNPEDIYAASKVSCEAFINVYSKILNQKFITIRPFGLYGKYEPHNRLMPLVFNAGMNNKPLNLTNGEQIRDYLDVRQLAYYILLLIKNNHKICNGEAINICSGNPVSIKDFINKIIRICKFNPSLYNFGAINYRENESMYFVGNCEKLNNIIETKIDYDIDESILTSFRFYLEEIKNDN